jgi:hypothetical protein
MIKKLVTIIFLMSGTCFSDIIYDETGLTITDFIPESNVGSPCVNNGELLGSDFDHDFYNFYRGGDYWDLGVFESDTVDIEPEPTPTPTPTPTGSPTPTPTPTPTTTPTITPTPTTPPLPTPAPLPRPRNENVLADGKYSYR